MAYTQLEKAAEFWMLVKGVLQDSTVDTEEARVIRHWLDEHRVGDEFNDAIARLDKFLTDGYIDRYESKTLVDALGTILRLLRTSK